VGSVGSEEPSRSRLATMTLMSAVAVVLAVALTFAAVELPVVVNRVLAEYFPDYVPAQPEAQDFLRAWRPVGYACLAAVGLLILAGFITRRKKLSSLGVVLYFMPTFGYFASYMFFLAGLGILRVAWIPFWNPALIRLGDIAYLPYMAIVYPYSLVGLDVRNAVAYLCVGIGFFLFVLGMAAWLYGKASRRRTITFWIYRYSRHPQYLGFIVWSYGVMLLASFRPVPWGGQNPGASLPWLISTLVVVSMALWEEAKMGREDGAGYRRYRESAPFLFPVPRWVASAITAPVRAVFGRDRPRNGRQIAVTLGVYSVVLLALSGVFLTIWRPKEESGKIWYLWPFGHPPGQGHDGPPGGGEEPSPSPGGDTAPHHDSPSPGPAPGPDPGRVQDPGVDGVIA